MTFLSSLNNKVWLDIETHFLPPLSPRFSASWAKSLALNCFKNAILLPAGLFTGIVTLVHKIFTSVSWTRIKKEPIDWKTLEISEMTPGEGNPDFEYSISSSTYQDSGSVNCPNSQWKFWESQCIKNPSNRSGKSANLFYLYKHDPHLVVQRLLQLGVTGYRTSIEWSHIEPEQGNFNYTNLETYSNFFKLCRQQGIAIDITLHHFSEPDWFHKKGSFTHPEGPQDFGRFVTYVMENLKEAIYIRNFWTINEPAIEAFSRYIRGAFSPGLKMNFPKAAQFLLGAFKAHNVAYDIIHHHKRNAKVGFTHQYLKFLSTSPLFFPITRYLNAITNDATLGTLETNLFKLKIPFLCNIREPIHLKVDQMGVQIYTRPVIGFTGSTTLWNEPMTLMPFREDPEAAYEAVTEVARVSRRAVIVTETGISTQDEVQRARYLTRVLHAIKRALRDGVPVAGVNLWTFTDQLEWDMGMKPQAFGCYSLTPQGTLSETFRAGVQPFVDACQRWKDSLEEEEIRAFA